MKNRLFTLAAMALVTLLVVSISSAQVADFRMVEDPPSPPAHGIGDPFVVECRMDALTAHGGANLKSFMIYIQITAGTGSIAVASPPFDPTSIPTGFTVQRNEPIGADGFLLSAINLTPGAGLPITADNILLAEAQFTQTSPGPANLIYRTDAFPLDGTRYSLLATPTTRRIPTVFDIDVGLPVTTSVFTATPADKGVVVKWRTESELNNLGFDVYRSESLDGTFIKVNQTRIPGAGTDGTPHSYRFIDENVEVGNTYYYYIEDISYDGLRNRSHTIRVTVDVTGKLKVVGLTPSKFALLQNFPNPFNPETWIPYQLSRDTSVTVRIYNFNGQPIRTIALGQQAAGTYLTKDRAVYWDGRDNIGEKVASGVYFYTLQAGDFKATKRMVIVE
jgi:hypothetical protein